MSRLNVGVDGAESVDRGPIHRPSLSLEAMDWRNITDSAITRSIAYTMPALPHSIPPLTKYDTKGESRMRKGKRNANAIAPRRRVLLRSLDQAERIASLGEKILRVGLSVVMDYGSGGLGDPPVGRKPFAMPLGGEILLAHSKGKGLGRAERSAHEGLSLNAHAHGSFRYFRVGALEDIGHPL